MLCRVKFLLSTANTPFLGENLNNARTEWKTPLVFRLLKMHYICGLRFACGWLFLLSRNTAGHELKGNPVLRYWASWHCAYLRNFGQP